jgi:peptide/nickel transport system ATP-binding protein
VSVPLLSIRNLRISAVNGRTIELVRGMDLDVLDGEKVAIVGESGSGKTISMLSVLQLLAPGLRITAGSIVFEGHELLGMSERRLRSVRNKRIAFVYQDPMGSLNPLLRIGTQLVETIVAHGAKPADARRRALEGLNEVALPDPERVMAAYPHELSGGMLQRVMIAMALSNSPRLLIADEPTTALDVTIQEQIIRLVDVLQERHGMAVVWVTHDLGVVARLVDRVAVMYAGRIVETAPVGALFSHPEHPYTAGLLASLPDTASSHRQELRQIGGTPPDPARLPPGCPYSARCPQVVDRCRAEDPPLTDRGFEHWAACWRRPFEWQS